MNAFIKFKLLFATTIFFADLQNEKQFLVSGIVTDQNEVPLTFATVFLKSNHVCIVNSISDQNGNFIISDLSKVIYDLAVTNTRYSTKKIDGVVVDSTYYARHRNGDGKLS